MIRCRRSQCIDQSIPIIFKRFDVLLRTLVTFHERLMFGLFLIVYAFSGLPAASTACWPPSIALDLMVRSRVYGAVANRRERQTFDFLCLQEKQAMFTGVPRRLPVTDGFMEGML
jgi:hypothetical protein